jgi:transketolase
VEQLAGLRAVPGLTVIRPGDANETAVAWRVALEAGNHPLALVLTRQNVPTLDRTQFAPADGLRHGAYVLADAPNGRPDARRSALSGRVLHQVCSTPEKSTSVRVIQNPIADLGNVANLESRESRLLIVLS